MKCAFVLMIATSLLILCYLFMVNKQKTPDMFAISNSMTPAEMERTLHSYMVQVQMQCPESYRAGRAGDGGWDVCLLKGVAPSQPCVVYSFGIKHDWSFDNAMAETFQCQVRSYDPSINLPNHTRNNNIKFFNVGLGGQNGEEQRKNKSWTMRTFKTLLDDQHFENTDIDYLKFDIESSEYEAIKNMYADNSLRRVKQIGLEVHDFHRLAGEDHCSYILKTVKLFEKMGFKKWRSHANQRVGAKSKYTSDKLTCCYEMYYINRNFL